MGKLNPLILFWFLLFFVPSVGAEWSGSQIMDKSFPLREGQKLERSFYRNLALEVYSNLYEEACGPFVKQRGYGYQGPVNWEVYWQNAQHFFDLDMQNCSCEIAVSSNSSKQWLVQVDCL